MFQDLKLDYMASASETIRKHYGNIAPIKKVKKIDPYYLFMGVYLESLFPRSARGV